MDHWTQMGFGLACLFCFGYSIASAVFPWVAAEIVVVALPAITHSRWGLALLVLLAVAGQMTGKGIVYWLSTKAAVGASAKMTARIERWRVRMTRRRSSPAAIVFLSSTVGFPPFFAITAIAGALKLDFLEFLAAGAAGRLIRFGGIVIAEGKILGI